RYDRACRPPRATLPPRRRHPPQEPLQVPGDAATVPIGIGLIAAVKNALNCRASGPLARFSSIHKRDPCATGQRHGGRIMKTAIVIPARYASKRLPGKPLLKATGKYLVQHVYERACQSREAELVVIATDDPRILAAVQSFGGRAMATRRDHPSGT